jgi:hypothetical protein
MGTDFSRLSKMSCRFGNRREQKEQRLREGIKDTSKKLSAKTHAPLLLCG